MGFLTASRPLEVPRKRFIGISTVLQPRYICVIELVESILPAAPPLDKLGSAVFCARFGNNIGEVDAYELLCSYIIAHSDYWSKPHTMLISQVGTRLQLHSCYIKLCPIWDVAGIPPGAAVRTDKRSWKVQRYALQFLQVNGNCA